MRSWQGRAFCSGLGSRHDYGSAAEGENKKAQVPASPLYNRFGECWALQVLPRGKGLQGVTEAGRVWGVKIKEGWQKGQEKEEI